MKCPIDETELVMSERQGVEIDYCPKCRGVWLDRGELDKIIERAEVSAAPQSSAPSYHGEPYQGQRDYGDRDERYDPRRKKKKSMLGELFDF
jgi:uncharacterized protein